MGINEKLSKEKDKVSGMNKEQKWEYFKAYYLAKTICVVIAIILLIWFVNDTILQKKVVSAGCVYSVPVSDDAKEALTTGFLDYYHYSSYQFASIVHFYNGHAKKTKLSNSAYHSSNCYLLSTDKYTKVIINFL